MYISLGLLLDISLDNLSVCWLSFVSASSMYISLSLLWEFSLENSSICSVNLVSASSSFAFESVFRGIFVCSDSNITAVL